MAWTIARYRANNPGTGSRSFNLTAGDGDVALSLYTLEPKTPWTPDSWNIQSTDGSSCTYIGQWRAALSSSSPAPADLNDTLVIFKEGGLGSGGSVRLTLKHLAVRP